MTDEYKPITPVLMLVYGPFLLGLWLLMAVSNPSAMFYDSPNVLLIVPFLGVLLIVVGAVGIRVLWR